MPVWGSHRHHGRWNDECVLPKEEPREKKNKFSDSDSDSDPDSDSDSDNEEMQEFSHKKKELKSIRQPLWLVGYRVIALIFCVLMDLTINVLVVIVGTQ
jgi:hypothetical protein